METCQYCSGTGWGHPDNPAGRCFSCHGSGFAKQPLTQTAARLLEDLGHVNSAKRARIRKLFSEINLLHNQQLQQEKRWLDVHREFLGANVFESYREQRELKRREMGQLAYEIASLHAEGDFLMERPATAAECQQAQQQALEEENGA